MTFNQANDVQVRPDVSALGWLQWRAHPTSRKPEGGINPEADLVSNNDFWGQFAAYDGMPFQIRVGARGRQHGVDAVPATPSTAGSPIKDRNGILTYDAGLQLRPDLRKRRVYILFLLVPASTALDVQLMSR